MQGVGVVDETATPLAATLTWLMRHGAGMTGQIVFTWFEGKTLKFVFFGLKLYCKLKKKYVDGNHIQSMLFGKLSSLGLKVKH